LGEGVARATTIGAIALTVVSMVFAVLFARKRARVRIVFDLLRAGVSIGAILLMATLVGVATPGIAVAGAVAAGLGLGFAQGAHLEVTSGEGGFLAKRSPGALALWCVGVILMQAAGLASRSGAIQVGQAVAWFSACLGIGVVLGRRGPIRDAGRASAGAGVALLATALLATALLGGAPSAAASDVINLTDTEVCDLVVSPGPGLNAHSYSEDNGFFFNHPEIRPTSWCSTKVWFLPRSGQRAGFWVYLYATDAEAVAHFEALKAETDEWVALLRDTPTETIALDVGTEAWAWRLHGIDERVLILEPPFVLDGAAMDSDDVETVPAYQQVLEPMAATVANIRALGEETATDAAAPGAEGTRPDDSSTPEDESGTTAARPTPTDQDAPIDPQDAAAQAIGGLIAAAAIGLISWAEAAAEIGSILDGTSSSSLLDPRAGSEPSEPEAESIKEDPGTKEHVPEKRTDPCAFQLDKLRKALADWQKIQSEISALENEYALTTTRIENEGESDFLGAAFDVAMLAIDIRAGGRPPTSGMLRSMVNSWGQSWARSISSQMIQQAATGQPIDPAAITTKAATDATGLPTLAEDGNPASGAFGTFLTESITNLLAANRSYDYLKFMDTLAEPGALTDPAVMRAIERSSFESFQERIGPWVGVVGKYLDFWHKNQKWGEGVERRAAMRSALLTPIRQRIDELRYDLGNVTIERDGWRRDLAKCREETSR
jgi:hypothetical protein